ncbi:hypothetical protein [Sphingobacterium tabacisoli]|uniref:Uncharacterized protein n=1 Tax=Sphingobacterium tabacisoli TaxID=2044855 RepID=A0ABW5L4B5_9SPHI|nr:hypothetical protein [Sphingobacterium tabacisoli]
METKNEKQQTAHHCQCTCTPTTGDRGTDGASTCLALTLQGMATPLYNRFDQLLGTAVRMLELLEEKMDPPMDLNEELMDALDLKLLLKVGDTKFASMKKLFKTYEVNKKPYYLKHEVLDIIRHYEVISNTECNTL